jgi:enolase
MNHAAESASKEALDLLVKAVNGMTINDAFSILKGADNAATNYLKEQTNADIYRSFKPIINASMQQHKVAQKWTTISTKYNALPFTKDINPDLEDYITNKAIDGLFVLLAKQEKEIRKNPLARTSDILKKVFN